MSQHYPSRLHLARTIDSTAPTNGELEAMGTVQHYPSRIHLARTINNTTTTTGELRMEMRA